MCVFYIFYTSGSLIKNVHIDEAITKVLGIIKTKMYSMVLNQSRITLYMMF